MDSLYFSSGIVFLFIATIYLSKESESVIIV